MKKKLLFVLAGMFVLGAWLSPLHADSGPTKKKLGASVVWDPLIGDASQLSSNSNSPSDGSTFENLIDQNKETVFHTTWSTDMALANITAEKWIATLATMNDGINNDPGWHNLQVELMQPVSSFKFGYYGRNSDWHDNPNWIDIYATNDPDLGSSTVNADNEKWTKITELTPDNANFPGDVYVIAEPYESPVIELGDEYKYIRFVVKGTTHQNKVDTRMFANPEVTGVTWNVSEFQMYAPREITDPAEVLEALIDSVTTLFDTQKFEYGDQPGYVDSVLYKQFVSIYDEAGAALYDGATPEELTNYNKALRAAMEEFYAKGIHYVTDGYYNFVNGYPGYMDNQGVTKSMRVDANGKLTWTTTDPMNPTQLFKVTKLENGNYSIQNVVTKEYIAGEQRSDLLVPMTKTHSVDQQFKLIKDAPGQWNIMNVDVGISYHTDGHKSGAGMNGNIVYWPGDRDTPSAWYIQRVTDEEILNQLLNSTDNALAKERMALALDSAAKSLAKVNTYKPLITKVEQIKSNAQSPADGSAYGNLIDGNTGTIFHSVWSEAFQVPTELGASYGWHNLQVELDEAVSKIRFGFTGRVEGNGWTDIPNHITLYGTNDAALADSTTAADSTKWDMIVDMNKKEYKFPLNGSGVVYNSPEIDLGGAYKYLRFVVKHTTTMEPGNNRANSFASPEATGVTFNLSEFQVYDGVPTQQSQYYVIPGMKEAVDALNAAVKTANDKLNAGAVTAADVAALQTAYRLVDTLYLDRPAVFSTLKSVLNSASEIHNKAIGARIALIENEEQLTTNSTDPGQGGPLKNLIDGDLNTVFHSIWDLAMRDNLNITEQEWSEIAAGYEGSYGAGYHNLNVALKAPLKSFFFEYYSRNNDWHDNPTDMEIYATNDVDLFENPDAANTNKWTKITELTEGFPTECVIGVPYTSPMIDLGGEYKYIRFVIKNTCLANKKPDNTRDFSNPDITGITWNVSEFQMYTGLDPESIQYNYNEEVRVAADELNALVEKYSAYTENDLVSRAPIDELQAAILKLQEAYVDTTEVVGLYNRWKETQLASYENEESAGYVEYGDGPGQVDSEETLDAFGEAIDAARNSISATRPTKQQVADAKAAIIAASKEFMKHVGQVQPYVWYNIKSNCTYATLFGIPIHLDETAIGARLSIKPFEYGEAHSDVYSTWRFIPMEEEGTYAIQNLGTGQYMGKYNGVGLDFVPKMQHEKQAYRLPFYGWGGFKIQQDGVADSMACFKTDRTNGCIFNYPLNNSHQQTFKLEPVVELGDGLTYINFYPANSTQIMTLPWANKGENAITALNSDVETYAINNVISTEAAGDTPAQITLELTKKTDFEAGEPFIMVTTGEANEHGMQPLAFAMPAETAEAITDTSTIVANGIYGTLQGNWSVGAASLYFANSELRLLNDSRINFEARTGYIDTRDVVNQNGTVDKVITINGVINGIQNIEVIEDNTKEVNVYTLDGVLIKRNVKPADALKNLGKGIYIVGKKKILVK